ncbi:YvrJ family protein [Senegalia massiliensis]|uniref:YvrJ family protein n=1 Tax=Senegalia massiliensis TaxID=1720316 RepID=UPI00102F467A|nr:YvrJ family protein [Senegalia massiliensis]
MEIIFSQIANLGFPIVVSVFLLVRIESKLTDITSSINELTKAIISKTKEEVL